MKAKICSFALIVLFINIINIAYADNGLTTINTKDGGIRVSNNSASISNDVTEVIIQRACPHEERKETYYVAPTCDEENGEGLLVERCLKCGKTIYTKLNRVDHKYEIYETDPSCTSVGRQYKRCSVCKQFLYNNVIPSLGGHNWKYMGKFLPTKEEDGYELYVCSRCGNVDKRNIIKYGEDLGETGFPVVCVHEFETIEEQKASCGVPGWIKERCSICGIERTIDEPALAHDYYSMPPKYDKETHWYKCSRCDSTTNKEVHNFRKTGFATATCTSGGVILKNCSVCGCEERDITPALGHDFTYYYDDVHHWQKCRRCGEETPEEEHDIQVYNSTCDKNYVRCTKCPYEGIQEKEPFHYNLKRYSDSTYHWYNCLKCGAKYILKSEHEFVPTDESTPATCTKTGKQISRCECGKTRETSIPALGHDWGDYVIVKEATTTTTGKKTRTCKRIGCGAQQSQTIPKKTISTGNGDSYSEIGSEGSRTSYMY